ncbi:Tol-Pal system beta propeller repeat protein TolB [Psychromonas sp. MME2]|uniref:Tol-Pal system beta propeller repeat protein TolB n=1 Tax=unclassified Psychromonas TaxID=2614957 RepID=UPI00339C94A4
MFYRFILSFLFIVFSANVSARLEILITEGVNSARPVAVVPFQWVGAGDKPDNLSDIIAADLQRSGQFNAIAIAKMPQTPSKSEDINYALWHKAGVEVIVIGTIQAAQDAGQYIVSYQLFDVVKGNVDIEGYNPLLDQGRSIVKTEQLRPLAHKISDIVYEKLTGVKGAFSTKIAYVAVDRNDEHPFQLRISDYDGYNEKTILRSKQPIMSPSWSPDGRKLAYVSFEKRRSEIWVQDLFTQQRELITQYPKINGAPSFSPDGKELAIVLSKDGQPDIYTINLTTKALRRITKSRVIDTEPSWAPDGQSLVFTSERGGKAQVYQVTLATGKIKRVTWQGDVNLGGTITPNGDSLVVVTRHQGDYKISVQDLNSSELRTLTKTQLDESPSIAPNGSMIIYSTVYKGKQGLALVSMDGRFKANIPALNGEVKSPAWSPFLN